GPLSSPASWFWQFSLQSSCVRLSFHSPCPDIAASFSAFERRRRGGMSQTDRQRERGTAGQRRQVVSLLQHLPTDARECETVRSGARSAAGLSRIVGIIIAMLPATATPPHAEIHAVISTAIKA